MQKNIIRLFSALTKEIKIGFIGVLAAGAILFCQSALASNKVQSAESVKLKAEGRDPQAQTESEFEFLFEPAGNVILIGENHTSALHSAINKALIKKSAFGDICLVSEGFTPNEGRHIREHAPKACFFGIDDKILNQMGVFLKDYILLSKPNQRDIDIGAKELRLMLSQLENEDNFILRHAVKNTQTLNYVNTILKNSQPFDTEIVKHIAQEMSRIARDGQLLPVSLLDVYDATINNPKSYNLFVQAFLIEARDLSFVKNILPIYEKKALEENKPVIVSVGAAHLDGLYDLLTAEGIKSRRLNLINLSNQELMSLFDFILDGF